jgi:cell division septum initiation protein DivIVA
MQDKKKPDHAANINKINEKVQGGKEPKNKLKDELEKYEEVLKTELSNQKQLLKVKSTKEIQDMISELAVHLSAVKGEITKLGNNQLQEVLTRASANEDRLTDSIRKLKDQFSANSKNPKSLNLKSLKQMIEQYPIKK